MQLAGPVHLKDKDTLTAWLRAAILAGNVSDVPADFGFPHYVWVHEENQWFEARLTNSEQGWYKGYPLAADEVPRGATS